MKEQRGMIFNPEMVQAILNGKKTQTRRPVKPQPEGCLKMLNSGFTVNRNGTFNTCLDTKYVYKEILCPFGMRGDRIYVRETFCYADELVDGVTREDPLYIGYRVDKECRVYVGDGVNHKMSDPLDQYAWNWDHTCVKWRPSIHMPRWGARIILEITDVRVERVQDISYDDAYAEGVERKSGDMLDHFMGFKRGNSIRAFEMGWNSVYSNWDENPWVWVIEFKRIEV